MSEKQKLQETQGMPSSSSIQDGSTNSGSFHDYKNLSFFLERTSESIRRTTVMIQQLESEVARLKYEVMATENEYRNLRHIADDLELSFSKSSDTSSF